MTPTEPAGFFVNTVKIMRVLLCSTRLHLQYLQGESLRAVNDLS